MCGFSRRFDESYRYAFRKTQAGAIGRAAVFRAQTCDKLDPSGFFVEYARHSGGIFVDCNIHDIDLCLWYFGGEGRGAGQSLKLKSVCAVGVCAVEPGLAEHGDVDNGVGTVEFRGGRFAYFFSSRMMSAGQHDMCEIVGTEGKLVVNANPIATLVDVWEPQGVRREIPQHYYDRFEPAFVTEVNEFTACCLDGKELPLDLADAVRAVEIGCALQESLRSGKKIEYDEDGKRILTA